VDLSALANGVMQQLRDQEPDRPLSLNITPDLTVQGDERLLRAVLENLLGNAWKYSSKKTQTEIKFGCETQGDETVFYVSDQGAGFDMQFAHRLFVPFQRLHSADQFAGTGIGLATVQRIINRHGGRIWVNAKPEHGATFYFTLPKPTLREPIR
jgi:light-regulated signal transduction histidine kinase (bacteriophytochrome)